MQDKIKKKKSEWKASLSAIVSLRIQSAAHFEIKRFFLFLEISYKLKLTCSVDQHFKILPREIEYRSHCLHVTGTMSLNRSDLTLWASSLFSPISSMSFNLFRYIPRNSSASKLSLSLSSSNSPRRSPPCRKLSPRSFVLVLIRSDFRSLSSGEGIKRHPAEC